MYESPMSKKKKEYIKLKRRIVYRGDVYNAIEGERINVLPKVFDSKYMNGFHDGLKKALSTLANDVEVYAINDKDKQRILEFVKQLEEEWEQEEANEEVHNCSGWIR